MKHDQALFDFSYFAVFLRLGDYHSRQDKIPTLCDGKANRKIKSKPTKVNNKIFKIFLQMFLLGFPRNFFNNQSFECSEGGSFCKEEGEFLITYSTHIRVALPSKKDELFLKISQSQMNNSNIFYSMPKINGNNNLT